MVRVTTPQLAPASTSQQGDFVHLRHTMNGQGYNTAVSACQHVTTGRLCSLETYNEWSRLQQRSSPASTVQQGDFVHLRHTMNGQGYNTAVSACQHITTGRLCSLETYNEWSGLQYRS
jgi:hypothetical protein